MFRLYIETIHPKDHHKDIEKLQKTCKKKGLKFYLSNNVKLANKMKLDGAYIPSFNKDFSFKAYNFKKNFLLLGSAHSLKEIRLKEKQGVKYIFLSPIFKNTKNKKKLGIFKFLSLKKLTKKKIVALGGVTKNNIKILKNINIYNIASISLFNE